DGLGSCYLKVDHFPKSISEDLFLPVDYRKNDVLFKKLQMYAKAGKIIATVGDVSDLKFAGDRKITLIDVSNIPQYDRHLGLNWNGGHKPRVISTRMDAMPGLGIAYHSFIYEKNNIIPDWDFPVWDSLEQSGVNVDEYKEMS